MILKKSIVLSAIDNSTKKAVCNIEKQVDKYIGTLKLYNFAEEPEGVLSMGFICENRVVKSGLIRKSKMNYSFQTSENLILENLSCAIINLKGGMVAPLLFGSVKNTGISSTELKLVSSLSILDKEIDKDVIENELDKNEIFLEDQEQIETEIDAEMERCNECTEKCNSCKYREAFYEGEPPPQKTKFIDDIKQQLDVLFEKYPEEEFLEQIFPNSKWAKIDYNNDENYYVVGVIYEERNIKYICYGVPGIYSVEPPNELSGYSKWLPLDTEKPEEYGYWISYQDAETGENIEINVV